MNKFPIQIKSGIIFSIPSNTKQYIQSNKDGWYLISITKEKSKATWSMFKYLFGCQYTMMLEEIPEYPSQDNLVQLHEQMKADHGHTVLVDKLFWNGSDFVRSSQIEIKEAKHYTVEEMQLFWQGNQQLAAEYLNLNIPDPDPDWKNHWEKERHKLKDE